LGKPVKPSVNLIRKNAELDRAMKNLILSMVDMDNYLTEILAYNERVLTSKMEEEV